MSHQQVGVVVVTYNRADLLSQCLDALLLQQGNLIGKIFVVDNASTDHTQAVVLSKPNDMIDYIRAAENLGGAGGFKLGIQTAYEKGFDWIWMMDDDVLPVNDCLFNLLQYGDKKVLMPAREDKQGRLVEFSAIEYNLSNPFIIRPKVKQVSDVYVKRDELPELLELDNISFEGLLIHREVIAQIGYPYSEYFISGDDVDYSERIREAGYTIFLVKRAKLIRQLQFNQQEALLTWKGYYMYRNIFVIHFVYGRNNLVKLKPYFLILGAYLSGQFSKNPNLSFKLIKDAKVTGEKIKQQNRLNQNRLNRVNRFPPNCFFD